MFTWAWYTKSTTAVSFCKRDRRETRIFGKDFFSLNFFTFAETGLKKRRRISLFSLKSSASSQARVTPAKSQIWVGQKRFWGSPGNQTYFQTLKIVCKRLYAFFFQSCSSSDQILNIFSESAPSTAGRPQPDGVTQKLFPPLWDPEVKSLSKTFLILAGKDYKRSSWGNIASLILVFFSILSWREVALITFN